MSEKEVHVCQHAESDDDSPKEKDEGRPDFDWTKAIPDKSCEWVDIQHEKITTIDPEAFAGLDKCEYVCLRYNLIRDMSPVGKLNPKVLTELDLYDNRIKEISDISSFVNLETLDLSYNNIRKIEHVSTLKNLKKLYLCSNKISKIENLDGLDKLEVLELGANRIRVIENIPNFENLKELHLAKNKIKEISFPFETSNIEKTLRILTLQGNRLAEIKNLEKFTNMEELYLAENGISKIGNNLDSLADSLSILDISKNTTLTKLDEDLSNLSNLTDLWLNGCQLSDWKDIDKSLSPLKNLDCVYEKVFLKELMETEASK